MRSAHPDHAMSTPSEAARPCTTRLPTSPVTTPVPVTTVLQMAPMKSASTCMAVAWKPSAQACTMGMSSATRAVPDGIPSTSSRPMQWMTKSSPRKEWMCEHRRCAIHRSTLLSLSAAPTTMPAHTSQFDSDAAPSKSSANERTPLSRSTSRYSSPTMKGGMGCSVHRMVDMAVAPTAKPMSRSSNSSAHATSAPAASGTDAAFTPSPHVCGRQAPTQLPARNTTRRRRRARWSRPKFGSLGRHAGPCAGPAARTLRK
mmetsp:Transcript_7503/g.26802  ORF Transcript_7503/g.26802 Transcript_7503/m.26802 type:complete len:258 (-) Transcript_7503:10-783(-)